MDIRAVEFTPRREGDSPVLPDLLCQIPQDEDIATVTADGAYDTRRCHSAIIARGGTAIIQIRKTTGHGSNTAQPPRRGSCPGSGGNSLAALSGRVDLGLIRRRGQG